MLTPQDHIDIHELLALHAYLFDENQLDRVDELFTPDAVYDLSAAGLGAFEGIDTIRVAAGQLAASGHSPLAHFVTNIRITPVGDDEATVLSKGVMIMADGSLGGATHRDTVRRHAGNWRLARRVVTPTPAPVGAPAGH
ncbi:nuclear transport factor 2 family protein [Microbacterium sp. RD1]|uniref:nuclear transport factor 2 family protein n=1 Tax=Microbacterium sp. RD1 TaxID=3457313 RepID=UPI003FA54BD3